MSNEPNNNQNELIIARGVSKKDGKKPGQIVTRLFFDAETTQRVIDQMVNALNNQTDGVSVTILEGEGKNGPFGMIAASGLETRDDRPQQGQKRAYNAGPQSPVQAPQQPYANHKMQGGYKPKTPGYTGRK